MVDRRLGELAAAVDVVHRGTLAADRRHLLSASDALIQALTGETPHDPALWQAALTHGSLGEPADYQRLEFLGDRVLGLAIAGWLYEAGEPDEGRLSQRLNALVARPQCAAVARAHGIPAHVRLGKQARSDGGADSDNILGDVMEALVGACFVERGFAVAQAMVRRLWAEPFGGSAGEAKHPKSALQEWAAGNRRRVPEYRLVSRSGPDHAARFAVAVAVHGVGEAEAAGTSKQEAETAAAAAFLARFG